MDETPPPPALTKVVATIGPASENRVAEMIQAGMSVARLNFSHGTQEEHALRISKIREVSADLGAAIAILGDLPGPKMRVGRFPEGSIELAEGDVVMVRSGDGMSTDNEVLIDVKGLSTRVEPGHRIVLADGQVELIAVARHGDRVEARVRRGGPVADKKGVHLPDSDVPYELPTEEDEGWIVFAVEQGIDFLGVSFVGHAHEIETIRGLAPGIGLVSKIERVAARENLLELLEASDGIMVARGDLGVELELEELPIAQKNMLRTALTAGKFTITATEMLESMVTSGRPTRAEVTDVANAVLDGTDAVMLSAETAIGKHPVEAVATMSRIARAVERSDRYRDLRRIAFRSEEPGFSNAVALAAVRVCEALDIGHIVCFTETGNTVRLISRYRPKAEVIALSPESGTVRSMAMLAAVRPYWFRRDPSLEDMLWRADRMLQERGLMQPGEPLVFVAGVPPGVARSTNMLKVHRLGQELSLTSRPSEPFEPIEPGAS